ncbi:LOB domain-containing protein [Trifolium repens]|nr:LOB domain-containing protein [Trifolium repens]
MRCNGCRVLRKGCSEDCIIKPCLEWIGSSESQGNATLFLAKFYGRTGLFNLLAKASGQNSQGRLMNPTYGALGLFRTGQWNRCEAAVEAVLGGSNINDVIAVDGQTSSFVVENHILPTTYDICRVARGTNVDIKEKTQFKRVGSVFKPKSRVGLVSKATLMRLGLESRNAEIVKDNSSIIETELNGAAET